MKDLTKMQKVEALNKWASGVFDASMKPMSFGVCVGGSPHEACTFEIDGQSVDAYKFYQTLIGELAKRGIYFENMPTVIVDWSDTPQKENA
jgi:hypothetical protein